MINFLVECSFCKDNALFSIVYIFKQVLSLIFIIVPIILIVLVLIDIAKNVIAKKEEDMTKNRNIAIKRIIYAVAVFLVPFIVNVVMHLLYDMVDAGSNESFLACWEHANLSNVKICNEEAISNENARDEEKKAASDSKMSDYKNKSQEQANSREKDLGKKVEESDNNSNSSNNSGSSDDSSVVSDGGGNTSDKYIIFVGDSRMVGLSFSIAKSSNEVFIAKGSMGVIWLNGVARSSVIEELKKHNDANIIVNIGVNDITGVSDTRMQQLADMYMNFCKKILTDYPSSRLVVTNVGPVDETVGKYKVKNSEINRFNNILKKSVENTIVNGKKAKYCSFSYYGFKTNDGLHYMPNSYRDIIYVGFKNCLNE